MTIVRIQKGNPQVWYVPMPYGNNLSFNNNGSANIGGNPENYVIIGTTTIDIEVKENWKVANMYVNVFTNTKDGSSLFSFEVNALRNSTVTVGAGLTGDFEATPNETVLAGSTVNHVLDTLLITTGSISARAGYSRLIRN